MSLFIHPIIQSTALIVFLYVFFTGVQRVRFIHFHHKTKFPWKHHVFLGKIALFMLLVGLVLGLAMVRHHWQQNLMTMGHGQMALVLIPFILFGIISGLILDSKKGKQVSNLRVFHGINNTALLLLVLNQIRTGYKILKLFVLDL